MKKIALLLIPTLTFTIPFIASAHTSAITQSNGWNALMHIITSLDHIVTIVVVIAAVVVSQVVQRRSLKIISAVAAATGALLLAL